MEENLLLIDFYCKEKLGSISNLAPEQKRFIVLLARHGDIGMTVKNIATILPTGQSNIEAVLQRLQRANLVEIKPRPGGVYWRIKDPVLMLVLYAQHYPQQIAELRLSELVD
jgi:DNA-binding MarR family transcriptional regulator